MDQTFNDEYRNPEGDTGIDLDFDLDDDEFEDESGDLLRILGIAGGVAALVGGLMILLGRKRETPSEQLTKDLRKAVEKQDLGEVRKAIAKADLSALLSEARERANQRVRDINVKDLVSQAPQATRQLGDTVGRAAANVDLEAAITEVGRRLATIEREGRRGARRAQKEARHAFRDFDVSSLPDDVGSQLRDLWDQITSRAKDVGWEEALDEAGTQVRKLSKQARKSGKGLDAGALAGLLDALKSQVSDAGERVQKDVLPGVQDTLEEDVLPEARKRARQAGEALSAVADEARKRGGKLAEDYGPQVKERAGKTAEGAKTVSSQISDMLRALALAAVDRMLSDVLPTAKKSSEQVAETVREDTLPWLRHRAGEVRDRVREDVAPRVQQAASEAPGRVRDAVDAATPVVADTLSSVAGTVGDVVSRAKPRVEDVVDSGSSGVGGALSNVRTKAGDAVTATVDTTKYVTGETSRILFWLSMLSGLILLVFVPDREKQKEIWNNVQQFMGELRGMWSDFSDDEFDAADTQEYTGDAGV
jgi:hypothetical protein